MGVTQKVKPKKAKKKYAPKASKNPLAAFESLQRQSVNKAIVDNFTVPMLEEDRDTVEIGYGINLDRLVKGKATMEDLGALGFLANVTVILCEKGFGKDYEQLAVAGQLALVNAFKRGLKGGTMGLSGPEIQAVRGVYELHGEQMKVCGQGHLIAATNEVERRQTNGNVIKLVEVEAKQAA